MRAQFGILKRLYKLTGPGFARHALLALGAGLAPVLYNLIMADALKNVFSAAAASDGSALFPAVLAFALSITGFFLYNGTMWGFYGSSTPRMTGRVRKAIFAHLCGLPLQELERDRSAAVLALITGDAAAAENAYGYLLRYTVAAVLSGVTATVVMLARSPVMGLVILSAGMLQLLCNIVVVKPLQGLSRRIAKQIEETGAAMGAILDGNVTIRLYGMEGRMLEICCVNSLRLRALNMRLCLAEGVIKGGNTLVALASYLITLAIGAWMVTQGSLGLPELLFLTQVRGLVMLVVFSIGDFIELVQPAIASAERIHAFLDKPIEKRQYDIDSLTGR